MINVEHMLAEKLPPALKHPWLAPWVEKPVTRLLKRLLHEQDFKEFARRYAHLEGRDFVEQVLDFFNFSYFCSDREKEHIPTTGSLVIIANHPIGSLDGIALLDLLSDVRPDVKVVANDLLWSLEPLRPMLLPITNIGGRAGRGQLNRVHEHLAEGNALLIFPSGEVSRLRPLGVRDTRWQSGFLKIADKARAPILPIHVEGRNSWMFYASSMAYKPLSTLLLIEEMFRQRSGHIQLRIGQLIPFAGHSRPDLSTKNRVQLLRRHLYRIGKGKGGCFPTEVGIALPESKAALMRELAQCSHLATSPDGIELYFTDYHGDSALMRELGRVREITFREIGEGTGRRRDLDEYDVQFGHLILWDPERLEVAGGYRLGDVLSMQQKYPHRPLYSATLFQFERGIEPYLNAGVELGRSFIRAQYRTRYTLDYLWLGIGAYLRDHPQIRYLFGPVSISGAFPLAAQELLVWYFSHWYPAQQTPMIAQPKHPFLLSDARRNEIATCFEGGNREESIRILKEALSELGVSIPPLFKKYADLCDEGGVQFVCFSVDPNFNNSLDALLIVDLTKLKAQKRARYLAARAS